MNDKAGFTQWFTRGERRVVRDVVRDLAELGSERVRTAISWDLYHAPGGKEWIDWLLPTLSEQAQVLPCFHHRALHEEPRDADAATRGGPQSPGEFLRWFGRTLARYGELFEYVELWFDPALGVPGRPALDPDDDDPGAFVRGAAEAAHRHGLGFVLGGVTPENVRTMGWLLRDGTLAAIDVIGVGERPSSGGAPWRGWRASLDAVRAALSVDGAGPPLWITSAGYSTWRNDELCQVEAFLDALDTSADRLYWRAVRDRAPATTPDDAYHEDERDYHYGMKRSDGSPKLFWTLWRDGRVGAVREAVETTRRRPLVRPTERPVLVTGGAGFVGTNLASRLLSEGRHVIVYDNLSRPGVEQNLRWLLARSDGRLDVRIADIRDARALRGAVREASAVYHFAAQVAVTTSVADPRSDFEQHVRGTFELLEALRGEPTPPSLVFTSTNKVYGALDTIALDASDERYEPRDAYLRSHGLDEERPLSFHSPYGCSKGAADQYVLDYARTYRMPATVLRMSCIYGTHQHGNEDQGWVAHFVIRGIEGRDVTLFGDGRQVRDVLFVDDLVEALLVAQRHIGALAGRAFNIGGGPGNTTSLLELIALLRSLGTSLAVRHEGWRSGDQRYYVSDTRRFQRVTGWAPRTSVPEGVKRLHGWLLDQRDAAERRTPTAEGGSLARSTARVAP